MIRVKVRTIFRGQVAIHEKYLENALKKGLQIVFQERIMSIPMEEVRQKIKGKSHEPFKDRYTGEPYHLFYLDWRPDKEVQNKLL